jgi:hypothetical protein
MTVSFREAGLRPTYPVIHYLLYSELGAELVRQARWHLESRVQ